MRHQDDLKPNYRLIFSNSVRTSFICISWASGSSNFAGRTVGDVSFMYNHPSNLASLEKAGENILGMYLDVLEVHPGPSRFFLLMLSELEVPK